MAAVFNPVHRRGERIKWGLVSYTVVMFSVVTIQTAMDLNILSLFNIDSREIPGDDVIPPGPVGYQWFTSQGALNVIPTAMYTLTYWLTDSLPVSPLFRTVFTQPDANAGSSSSSIIATSYTPRSSGSSPSHTSCSSAR